MFDLHLIAQALEGAVEDAADVLVRREQDFAGAPEVGNVDFLRMHLAETRLARVERQP